MAKKHRINIAAIRNGQIIKAESIKFNMTEYDVIPLVPDDREYSRARRRRETKKALDAYYERGEDDGR